MRNLTQVQRDAAERTIAQIRSRCRPILVGFGGSIAYGLNTPASDVDIRGIFLNPPEEWIGLTPETEQIRLDDSDTMLYGLRKGMKLLLNGNPNTIELLGLRPEHLLCCTEEGHMICVSMLSMRIAGCLGFFGKAVQESMTCGPACELTEVHA